MRLIKVSSILDTNRSLNPGLKYLDFVKKLKNLENIKKTVVSFFVEALGIVPKSGKKNGGIGNQRITRDHLDCSNFKIIVKIQKFHRKILLPLIFQ